jgi:hypothetical protein
MLLEIARSCTKQNRQGSHREFFTALLELLKDNISPKFYLSLQKFFLHITSNGLITIGLPELHVLT